MFRTLSVFVALIALAAMAVTVQAQLRGAWEVLGEKRTQPGVESLVIDVPERRAGLFDAIKVAVRGGNVLLLEVEVTFGNGDRQEVDVRFPLTAGAETGPIDLRGPARFIRKIKVRYGALGFLGRPSILVLGHPVRARPQQPQSQFPDYAPQTQFRDLGPRWERLSVERVDQERDRDVIKLSRSDGIFDAVLLRVSLSPAYISKVRVEFGNGDGQNFDVPRILRPGQQTNILEFPGRHGRFVDRIILTYRDIGGPRRARVAVWARQAEPPRFRDLGPNWTKLSTERVNRKQDRDEIELSRRDGLFDAILLRVLESAARIHKVRVIFDNGDKTNFDLPRVLDRREESDVLELPGPRGRFIDRIILIYKDAGGSHRARVEVWGRQARDVGFRQLGPRWDEVGIMRAGYGGDRDVLELSPQAGAFDALLLRVRQNDVEFREVRVIYGNGEVDPLNVGRLIRKGQTSDVLELWGARGRFIDRIELTYRTSGSGPLAMVEIWGRRSLRR